MYAKYAYTPAATQANIMSDLVALLTGQTNKASLSAGCDQENTEIIATIPSGWTLHDAAAGTNKQVLKAPFSYNGSLFKYLMLDHYVATEITLYGYETWNEVSHTGTNQTQNLTNNTQRKGNGVAGVFFVFASAKFVALVGTDYTSWGDVAYGGITIFSEYTRDTPWSATTLPHAALIQTGACISQSTGDYAWAFPIKALDKIGNMLTGLDARAQLATIGVILGFNGYATASLFPNGGDYNTKDGLGNELTPLFPMYLVKPNVYGIPLGNFSVADFWLLPNNVIGNLTTFQYTGLDYIAVRCSGISTDPGNRIAFPKR
jgi:hypothetical protein